MVKLESPAIERAKELQPPPEPGKPYSLPIPGSERPGRSAVYRHWRFMDGLLETLDPNIRTAHDFFEDTGKAAELLRPFSYLSSQQGPEK
jgi:long-chain acyl-CoA synthetase